VVIGNAPKREGKRWFNDKYRETVKKRIELRKKVLQSLSEKKIDMKTKITEIEENRKTPKNSLKTAIKLKKVSNYKQKCF